MNRREFLIAGAAAAFAGRLARGDETPQSTLGIAEPSYAQRNAAERARTGKGLLSDPVAFVLFCHERGAGGVQMDLGTRDDDITRLEEAARERGMYLEASIPLPSNRTQVVQFERRLVHLRRAGGNVARTVLLPGRRYERFQSEPEFRAAADQAARSLALVKPVLEASGMRLAIENHKDLRTSELIALLERTDSPQIGVCLDTGNSIALLEDPMETVESLAPWAFSTHLKDMAVEEYADGFLLSEVPLGRGFIDLPRIVTLLRQMRPEIRFSLEMITRDPLKIPCLTQAYWASLGGVSGWPLARTLRMVHARASKTPLPRVSGLDVERRVQMEDDNVRECLKYARERLGLTA